MRKFALVLACQWTDDNCQILRLRIFNTKLHRIQYTTTSIRISTIMISEYFRDFEVLIHCKLQEFCWLLWKNLRWIFTCFLAQWKYISWFFVKNSSFAVFFVFSFSFEVEYDMRYSVPKPQWIQVSTKLRTI